MKKILCILTLCSTLLSGNSMAWSSAGHCTVGAIADRLLKGSYAEKQLATLLQPGENLENLANWMDCAKGSYCGAQTAEMMAYTSANPQHMEYHYTDIPFQNLHYRDGEVGSTDHDIVQSLKQAIAVLQGKADAASNPHHFTRRQALLLIAHLLGDLQQPLHVGAGYVGKNGGFVVPQAANDIDAVNIFNARGGNSLLLDAATASADADRLIPPQKGASAMATPSPGCPVPEYQSPPSATLPFHAYWDANVVEYAMRRAGARTPEQFADILIAAKPTLPANSGDPASWPAQWADDSLQAAKLAYAGLVPGPMAESIGRTGEKHQSWPLALPPDYALTSSTLARAQLTKGGYRLAALLEAIWPGPVAAR